MTDFDRETIIDAYEDVRNDTSPTMWLLCKYQDNAIVLDGTGDNYDDLLEQLGDDDRAFAFVRVIMGDELSKRAKFAFITWTGVNVLSFKKAKMGPDKQYIKAVISSFSAEVSAESRDEVELDVIRDLLQKAGGANYGTGVRD